ncbi:hypothetical protein Misp01_63560 [Microtetraspora sp. NBRC 13810]|uniref:AfsR/SARP family transcriptional regulator n=1 Tax=Microtetraspora sp. NBRC 13810 TaxID=3030990 RepID=UPI0024A3FA5F|nr:AfsR/SARP family transcriptional regulator [Microtetraspora sp. NBRC 13810]GLW11228.1 hypothetical protein Misp01_63560 [Microtetraspora sp. NBRC 13810]
MIQFGVLGSLEVRTAAGARSPKGPKARQVLALLLLRANEVVDVHTLAEELWDVNRARGGVGAIRTHVYNLRSALAADEVTSAAADMLVTESTGYMLRVEPAQLDALRFAELVERGRELFGAGMVAESARGLREALAMWRGRALANVTPGPVLSRHLTYLEELRTRAIEMRVEADMLLGNHRELVAELRTLIAASPLNEWYHTQLIDVLFRSGRRGEALRAFHSLRKLLDQELGLEPSADARRLQHEILAAGSERVPGDTCAVCAHAR